jgi:hypothetical protein
VKAVGSGLLLTVFTPILHYVRKVNMATREEIEQIGLGGEVFGGYEDTVESVGEFSSDTKVEDACQKVYNKAVTEAIRRTTLIVVDMVAFHFKLATMVTNFIKDNPWVKDHVEELTVSITKKAGDDLTKTYDVILSEVREELSRKYREEKKDE